MYKTIRTEINHNPFFRVFFSSNNLRPFELVIMCIITFTVCFDSILVSKIVQRAGTVYVFPLLFKSDQVT